MPTLGERPRRPLHEIGRVLRVAAWVAAVVGAVLTFVIRGSYHIVHLDVIHTLMYPVPAIVVVALLAGTFGG